MVAPTSMWRESHGRPVEPPLGKTHVGKLVTGWRRFGRWCSSASQRYWCLYMFVHGADMALLKKGFAGHQPSIVHLNIAQCVIQVAHAPHGVCLRHRFLQPLSNELYGMCFWGTNSAMYIRCQWSFASFALWRRGQASWANTRLQPTAFKPHTPPLRDLARGLPYIALDLPSKLMT